MCINEGFGTWDTGALHLSSKVPINLPLTPSDLLAFSSSQAGEVCRRLLRHRDYTESVDTSLSTECRLILLSWPLSVCWAASLMPHPATTLAAQSVCILILTSVKGQSSDDCKTGSNKFSQCHIKGEPEALPGGGHVSSRTFETKAWP